MLKIGAWNSEGYLVMFVDEESGLSFSSREIGFFEEPGCLSFLSIKSMYNLLP